MDFYRELNFLSDEELEKELKLRIKELEDISDECNPNIDTIGYLLDYNPKDFHLTRKEDDKLFKIDYKCFYTGYVKKGMRIVYGLQYDLSNGVASNNGRYYYIDDESYIMDFCKFIRDIEIENEYELFGYVLDFMNIYFGNIETISREDMFKMILKNDYIKYNITNEHKFSSFKGKGNGLCSEKTIMANNILNVFGMCSYILFGVEKICGEDESHAYNIVSFDEEESGEEKSFLIDFSSVVKVYDVNYNIKGPSPFMGELEDLTEEFVLDVIMNGRRMIFEEYAYVILNNCLLKISDGNSREYYVEKEIYNKQKVKSYDIINL